MLDFTYYNRALQQLNYISVPFVFPVLVIVVSQVNNIKCLNFIRILGQE